jgi:hypothetical protein
MFNRCTLLRLFSLSCRVTASEGNNADNDGNVYNFFENFNVCSEQVVGH